ncbi:putative porin [Rheinheimera salexigens]|uniref:Putative porin n=1 Tax=Rheinheimera salexigens TaxID=1628148 RepID=A0A1E7Q704_9GAMM|nr:putative porin [Rheinheimera salexigens]OEY69828.1 putative porin [Rheinheimera salexigens]
MSFKYILPIMALTASATIAAEEYQLFTELKADHVRVSGENETNWALDGTYFFDKKQTLGPLDQFEYINKVSNIGASFNRVFDNNVWAVDGEYFFANNIVVSASHQYFGSDFNVSTFGLGYLLADNFIVRAEAIKPKDESTAFLFSASYDLQLQNNDYIGFTAKVDDEFDYFEISSKYFASFGQASYFAIGLGLADYDGTTAWNTELDYYFTKMTSVGVTYNKQDDFSVNAKHYLSSNWALNAGYGSNADTSAVKVYSLSVIGQF